MYYYSMHAAAMGGPKPGDITICGRTLSKGTWEIGQIVFHAPTQEDQAAAEAIGCIIEPMACGDAWKVYSPKAAGEEE